MTKIANLVSLACLMLGTALAPVKAYDRDGKTDWNYFQEWLIEDSIQRTNDDRSWKKSQQARRNGNFWNVRKAYGFGGPDKIIDHPKNGQKRCVIAFYYPMFWSQLVQAGGPQLSNDQRKWAFERPLAMSPWCTPEPLSAADDFWIKGMPDMIVFHNYYTRAVDNDLYFVMG
jgi:hypothetical protein